MESQHFLLLRRSLIDVDLHSARTRSFSLTNESKVSLVRSWTSLAVARAARAARPKAYFIVKDKRSLPFLGGVPRYVDGGSSKKRAFSQDIYVEEEEGRWWWWSGVKGQVVDSC